MKQTVLHNQSMLDIAVQVDGSVFNVLNWSLANRIPVTDTLDAGQQLNTPGKEHSFEQVATFFKNKAIVIGTYYTAPEPVTEPEPTIVKYEFPQSF
ncbi:hypothetical protein [Flavobacterium caeni]|uniref:LysM domain-containing protein n=1 Tax=Flavobacterium caeni TaxID=490189 RepID=A0A1G5K4K0_9FLAO|nr:hypothetical protein [Flavobacterium caeni]SCY94819.1 hypothetical protein SAMN02927903_03056 [Flavobacterium caeni]